MIFSIIEVAIARSLDVKRNIVNAITKECLAPNTVNVMDAKIHSVVKKSNLILRVLAINHLMKKF